MHIALTDRLSCPRCGPEFGLILLAEEVRAQRVFTGELGCSNCRERYPVRRGFADFRIPPEPSPSPDDEDGGRNPPDPEESVRLGALLGVTEGPGTILISGEAAWHARNLASLIGGIEVVGMDASLAAEEESEGFSRIAAGRRLPFFTGTFLGVLASQDVDEDPLAEMARVLAPGGRLVILDPEPDAVHRVTALDLQLLLEEKGVLVARRKRAGTPPLITLRGF